MNVKVMSIQTFHVICVLRISLLKSCEESFIQVRLHSWLIHSKADLKSACITDRAILPSDATSESNLPLWAVFNDNLLCKLIPGAGKLQNSFLL